MHSGDAPPETGQWGTLEGPQAVSFWERGAVRIERLLRYFNELQTCISLFANMIQMPEVQEGTYWREQYNEVNDLD